LHIIFHDIIKRIQRYTFEGKESVKNVTKIIVDVTKTEEYSPKKNPNFAKKLF